MKHSLFIPIRAERSTLRTYQGRLLREQIYCPTSASGEKRAARLRRYRLRAKWGKGGGAVRFRCAPLNAFDDIYAAAAEAFSRAADAADEFARTVAASPSADWGRVEGVVLVDVADKPRPVGADPALAVPYVKA